MATLSTASMIAIGGEHWTKGGHNRVYLDGWSRMIGMKTVAHKSGTIGAATYKGVGVSNTQAGKFIGCIDRVWFDAADGELHYKEGFSESRLATREQVWADIVKAIHDAIDALPPGEVADIAMDLD